MGVKAAIRRKHERTFQGVNDVLYFDKWPGLYVVCIYQTPFNYTLKIAAFEHMSILLQLKNSNIKLNDIHAEGFRSKAY